MSKKLELEQLKKASDYLRYLALMAIQRAKSGHPGMPLGCAELGILLYKYIMKGSGKNPLWLNRDRFILSAGHGSMFIYALNYMFGYKFSLEDLAAFRQKGSLTPGHPEHDLSYGIETTTGPLGQGFANAVGAAIESKQLAARFNTGDQPLFDYNIYSIAGDGCLMEGVSYEAASMAGHLGLDNLIVFYDSNKITIDGDTDITFTEDVAGRFKAQGWHVEECAISDINCTNDKIDSLSKVKGKPKLVILKTVIGQGLDKLKGTHKVHGAAAGFEEIAYFFQNSSITSELANFHGFSASDDVVKVVEEAVGSGKLMPRDFLAEWLDERTTRNNSLVQDWQTTLDKYKGSNAEKHKELMAFISGDIPADLIQALTDFSHAPKATRNISSAALQLCAEAMPQITGGSADLVGSTLATVNSDSYFQKDNPIGRNIAFGVREHAMGSIGNGLSIGGTSIAFTSTFFSFFDYMKEPVRLAALMQLKHLFIFTHDSVLLGEDGPTHQPIEHIGSLRLLPGINTLRPCNDIETGFSYRLFLEEKGPKVIIGTRQSISEKAFETGLDRAKTWEHFKKGAYIISGQDVSDPDIILAGSGSEVGFLLDAAADLTDKGKKVRVISIPCMERFDEADGAYRQVLFGDGSTPVYLMEALSYRGLHGLIKDNIHVSSIDRFGESAALKDLVETFGYTTEKISSECLKIIEKK